jgi:basic membrane lipoprotein Med (substrate-binding protein (PBP1-ABC) superfamily)
MRRAAAGPLAALALVVACAPGATREAGFRVALVAPGSIADAAWNAGAYAGLLLIRDSLGVTVSDVEARTPGEQEEALRTYAAQGFDLVFGHGFEFQQPAERVATEHPGTVFIVTSGERAGGNVAPLVFRIEEGTFLAGMVAGGMTASGKIGFVGGIELPPIRRGYHGWVAGARRVNPAVDTRVSYLNNFDDAAAGREAALAMIRLGVDMLHHNADAAGLGVFQAAKASPGVFVFGANADQSDLAPDRVIGSAVIDLRRAFLAVAREVKEGRFTSSVQSFGLDGGVVRYVPNHELEDSVPPALRTRVRAARDSIIAGTLIPLPPAP